MTDKTFNRLGRALDIADYIWVLGLTIVGCYMMLASNPFGSERLAEAATVGELGGIGVILYVSISLINRRLRKGKSKCGHSISSWRKSMKQPVESPSQTGTNSGTGSKPGVRPG